MTRFSTLIKILIPFFLLSLPLFVFGQFWEFHWNDGNYVFTGSGGDALTVTQTDCEEGFVQVSDPVNAPLPSFSPIIINPKEDNGEDIVDISSSPLQFTMRARSVAEVTVGALFRSDDGGSDFRTARLSATIPADLDNWTEITIEFTGADISGFNAANLRDFWIYLDPGSENFAGNEFYIDYIALGGSPTPDLESPCTLGEEMMDGPVFAEYFQGNDLQNVNQNSSAGQVSTFTLDTICETLQISVTDPVNAPLTAFNAYQINPFDAAGNEITDISENVNVTMRVRSAEEVNVAILFRSGEGGSDERSDRKDITIPAGLDDWTSFTLTFEESDFAGFDPAALRDMWVYLDRGEENFAGNEFYIDHIVIGGMADSTLNSPCMDEGEMEEEEPVFAEYFQGNDLQNINQNSSAGQVSTFTLDTICETLQISVTDPVNAPLTAFNAYQINPFDAAGNEITDISENVNVTMRVRSAEEVNVAILFRSGEGGSDERSDRKDITIPAGLDDWTSFTLTFEESDFAGFDPAALRDMWVYLDRGEENFAGNEFYIDHIVIGGMADSTLNSPCDNTGGTDGPIFVDYFEADSLTSLNTNSTAGRVSTFTLDTLCETVQISVTDPDNEPVPSFNAFFINPVDDAGNDITDITGNVNVTMRVRSAETVIVDILFRSGEGTQEERSERKAVTIPGDLENWTTFTLSWDDSELDGFNPATLRDMWFYLDRGTPNFAGNEFYIDHVVIGGEVDSTKNSPCTLEVTSQTWIENWDTENATTLGGSATSRLTLTQTACEELKIEVTDPINNPYQAFRPIVIEPMSPNGASIKNISDNVQVVIRARSAETVPVSVLFRSGDGSTDFRTSTLTQDVQGSLEGWTTLTYTFTAADLGGFNPEDLVDLWIYLDRENDNFPGNEIYFDYIAIGEQPDTSLNSPCGLPDLVVNTRQLESLAFFDIFPNPVKDQLQIHFKPDVILEGESDLFLFDMQGRLIRQQSMPALSSQFSLDVSDLSEGVFFLQIRNQQYQFTKRLIKY